MFEIPENLPLRLGPLAWMLGEWQGWGTLITPASPALALSLGETEDGEVQLETDVAEPKTVDSPIIQQLSAEVLGDQMALKVTFFAAVPKTAVDPMWSAGEGLDNLEAGDVLWEETQYWSVTSPLAVVPSGGEEPRELRVTSASSRGYATLFAGVAIGPRIRLDSDAIAYEPFADPVNYISRMFGLVGGELMWASDNKLGDADFETEFTGRLQRVEKEEAS